MNAPSSHAFLHFVLHAQIPMLAFLGLLLQGCTFIESQQEETFLSMTKETFCLCSPQKAGKESTPLLSSLPFSLPGGELSVFISHTHI